MVQGDIFKNVIAITSLCGTVAFLSYLVLLPIMERYCSIFFRYTYLKLVGFFFLFPFPVFAVEIRNFIEKYLGFGVPEITLNSNPFEVGYAILVQQKSVEISPTLWSVWKYAIGMAVVCIFVIAYKVIRYYQVRKFYLKNAMEVSGSLYNHLVVFQQQVKVKKVRFVFSDNCTSPCVLGVFQPTVVLPPYMEEDSWESDWDYMILHELYHVKNKDFLFRVIGLVIMGINWFNPFIYILLAEISNVTEYFADFCTVHGKSDEIRKKYADLIVDMATESGRKRRAPYVAFFFNNNVRTMKRRVLQMKRCRKNKVWVSCLLASVICLAGTATALVYQPAQEIKNVNEKIDITEANAGFLKAEDVIIEDNGNLIYSVNDTEEQAICWHDYKDTVKGVHQTTSGNGCKVTYMTASECKKCGKVILKDIILVEEFDKCTH